MYFSFKYEFSVQYTALMITVSSTSSKDANLKGDWKQKTLHIQNANGNIHAAYTQVVLVLH